MRDKCSARLSAALRWVAAGWRFASLHTSLIRDCAVSELKKYVYRFSPAYFRSGIEAAGRCLSRCSFSKSSNNSRDVRSSVNRFSMVSRAARARRSRKPGFSNNRSTEAASIAGSPGFTSKPLCSDLNKLRNCRNLGRDYRHSTGHRFVKDVRDAVTVAVRSDYAWKDKQCRALIGRTDSLLVFCAYEADAVLQIKLSNLGANPLLEWAAADDFQTKLAAALTENPNGRNQVPKAFLFDQPAHGEDERRTCVAGARPSKIELAQVQAVVDARQLTIEQRPKSGYQVLSIVFIVGNDCFGPLDLRAQQSAPRLDENVSAWSLCRGHACAFRHRSGYRGALTSGFQERRNAK